MTPNAARWLGRLAPAALLLHDASVAAAQQRPDALRLHHADAAPMLRGLRAVFPPHSTRRNALVITATGAAAFAITWVLPEELSKWDKSQPVSYYLTRAYTEPPVWDRDPFFWNWIVHPLAGTYAYLMERNHGRSPLRGFLLATAASVGWEYGFEAFIEQPSAQDLLITSPVGAVLGEMSHQLTRRMRRGGFSTTEKVVLTIVNPVQVVQHGYRE